MNPVRNPKNNLEQYKQGLSNIFSVRDKVVNISNGVNTNFKVFIFFLILCLLPLKLPAADQLPFADSKITISMDFQDANLKDIVKILSIQSGLNFIASEAVQERKITLYLDRVPIKEVMDKLFKANNLTYELDKDANIFIVKDWGKPELETITRVYPLKYRSVPSANLEKEKGSLLTTASGSTTGTGAYSSTSTGGGSPLGQPLGVSTATSNVGATGGAGGIVTSLKQILSNDGKITEDTRTNSLIITDVPSRFPEIERIIAFLDIPQSQVMLEVEILDVSKNTVDKIGLEFGQNPFTFIAPGSQRVKTFIGDMTYRSLSIPGAAGAVVFGHTFAEVLDFLRTQTDTKYLARPRLLTLNNETAEISITKDEVVGKVETAGTQTSTPTVNYIRSTDLALTKEGTGIFLRVTPQINLETDEITMVINPKSSISAISPLSTTANQQSDVEIRSTKSIVKVKDGETVILGGLIHNDKQVTTKKLPILGDIPFLGALFRHKNQTKDLERELLIFITPHIIKDKNVEFAQAKKTGLAAKGQNTASIPDRQLAIETSLNSFEKVKEEFH